MKRTAFKMKLKPGYEQEYRKRHEELWPDLHALLKRTGIEEYSIFLDPTTLDLVGYFKIKHNKLLDTLPNDPVMKKWWSYMKDIMETNEDHSPRTLPLEEVFYMP